MGKAADVVTKAYERHDANDLEGNMAYYAADAELQAPGMQLHGTDQIKGVWAAYRRAFPDGRHTFESVLEAGEAVAVELSFVGTQTGPLAGPAGEVPPSGRAVHLRFAEILRVRDGRITSEHIYFDQLDMLGQLGLMPQPAAGDATR
jgi:predicted ester cyclase